MRLTAIFETWHIGDGNYPPLFVGQAVNLSFEIYPYTVSEVPSKGLASFEQLVDAEYRFVGKVLRTYNRGGDPIVVVQADQFRFYINSFPDQKLALQEGDIVEGRGRLSLDHYIWVEFISSYRDPPNLFYQLRVTRIRAVRIPESFVSRHERGKSYPTSLSHIEYSGTNLEEIQTMDDFRGDEVFFLVDFDDSGLRDTQVPLTFR